MNVRALLVTMGFLILTGCAHQPQAPTVSLPMLTAWFNGKPVHYVTTDVSDRDLARQMNANFAPRLRDAIPDYPKPPGVNTVLERVYGFPQGTQTRTVFASRPEPAGYQSQDVNYSPVWLLYKVEWENPDQARELRSEGAILKAASENLVTVTRTRIVINCPVVNPAPDS